MEESVTYQAIIAKGAKRELRKVLMDQGGVRFGTPAPTEVQTAIESIDDLARLEELARRIMTAGSWPELLQSPAPPPAKKPARKTRL